MRPPDDGLPIPEPIAALERDERGYPIFFIIKRPDPGDDRPLDFRVTDIERILDCLQDRLCGVCGTTLGYWIAYLGGPISRQTRVFYDPGMHEDCARYAAAVCPFLSRDKARYSDRDYPDTVEAVAPTHDRPDEMFIMIAREYDIVWQMAGRQRLPYSKVRPWKRVEPIGPKVAAASQPDLHDPSTNARQEAPII